MEKEISSKKRPKRATTAALSIAAFNLSGGPDNTAEAWQVSRTGMISPPRNPLKSCSPASPHVASSDATSKLVTPPDQVMLTKKRRIGSMYGASEDSDKKMTRRKDQSTSQHSAVTRRTESFSPLWAGQLPPNVIVDVDPFRQQPIEPHTLILGTHPSVSSLECQQYYAHPMNAFWWIAGDCLGFRRDLAISPTTGKPYQFASELWYNPEHVLSYTNQVQTLISKGFALWDVVQSCERKGSLDQDIKDEVPNKIRVFCQAHPNIRRIVLANGSTACQIFRKHFENWLLSDELIILDHPVSQRAFSSILKKNEKMKQTTIMRTPLLSSTQRRTIEVVCALSVSPAAANLSYATKRDFWNKYVYQPGLADFSRERSRVSRNDV